MSEMMMSGLIVGILVMLFWTPFLMAREYLRLTRDLVRRMLSCALFLS